MMPTLELEFPQVSRVQMCRILGISRSESYRRSLREAFPALSAMEKMAMLFLGYGYRRMTLALRHHGFEVSQYAVRKTMLEQGLSVRQRRKSKGITKRNPRDATYENLLRKYAPTRPDEVWATDMTLIRTRSGAVYLAAMLDIYSRRVVAMHLSRSPDLNLALACLDKALSKRHPASGWIHHSDQGSVYTAPGYIARVRASGGRVSMSRTATPTDNAYVESFFKTLKQEEIYANRYDSYLELEASVENYIEHNYNAVRLHSSLGYLSPNQFEAQSEEVG